MEMEGRMKTRSLWIVLLCGMCETSMAGINSGGTIFVHDANLAWTSDNSTSYCGLGPPPATCADADVELDGSGRR